MVTTGIVAPELARRFAPGRLCGAALPAAPSTRAPISPIGPYNELQFDVPLLKEGDVNARVWICVREIEQSLVADRANPRSLAGRGDPDLRFPPPPEKREAAALVEGFRGDIFVWLRLAADGTVITLPSARSVVVSMAAAGGGGRGQYRRRFPALQ